MSLLSKLRGPRSQEVGGILQRYGWDVQQEGDRVLLKIGNAQIRMGYLVALRLGFRLMFRGRQAKRWAGDLSTGFDHNAELTDMESDIRKDQAHVVATATVIPRKFRDSAAAK